MDTSRPVQEALNVVIAVLGIGLALAPRIVAFADATGVWHACFLGAALTLVAASAMVMFFSWEEWLNVALGVWAMAAPWALGFSQDIWATRTHLVVGALVVVAAGVELRLAYRPPERERRSYRRARAR